MNFTSHNDDSGDIEVMFEMNFMDFLTKFGDVGYIQDLISWKDDYTIYGFESFFRLLNDEFRQWVQKQTKNTQTHINSALNHSVHSYNAIIRKRHDPRTVSDWRTVRISWYMNRHAAAHMKLIYG